MMNRTTVSETEQKWVNQERKLHIKLEKYLLVSPKSQNIRYYWDKNVESVDIIGRNRL